MKPQIFQLLLAARSAVVLLSVRSHRRLQCHMQSLSLEAKDAPPLLLPAPVNEVTEILTLTICHKDRTEVSFVRSHRSILTTSRTPSFSCQNGSFLAADISCNL